MKLVSLLLGLAAGVIAGRREDNECLQSCAVDYRSTLDALSARHDLSLRMDPLAKVCAAYRPARQCSRVKCKDASPALVTLYFDMDVPCNAKYQQLFEQNARCLSRTMRSQFACKQSCRQDAQSLAEQSVSNNPHFDGHERAASNARRLIEECHTTECLSDCLTDDFARNCQQLGGDAKVAATLHREWQRSLLNSRRLESKSDGELPAACDWAVEKSTEGGASDSPKQQRQQVRMADGAAPVIGQTGSAGRQGYSAVGTLAAVLLAAALRL